MGMWGNFHRTLNSGLSHYVNASGTIWGTLLPFYLMSYNTTPYSSTNFSPFYLLPEREIVLPTSENLRAKLPPEIRDRGRTEVGKPEAQSTIGV
jgi:hypothetical protein